MTTARETIEKDEPRLVTPEQENHTEAPILEAIERDYCQLDNAQSAFNHNWTGWQSGNDISKEHLGEDLEVISSAALSMRERIGQLAERRVREPEDVQLETCAEAIRQVTDEMCEGWDYRTLPGQVERIESTLQALREEFELSTY